LKVLFIAKQMPWDSGSWGGDDHSFQLSVNIIKQGHKVIFVNSSLHSKDQLDWQPYKLPYITYRGRLFYPKTEALSKIIDEIKPDIVHHFSTMGYHFEGKLRNGDIPSVCSLWTDRVRVAGLKSKWRFILRGKPFRYWAAHCEQFSANHANCITTSSKTNAKSLEQSYNLSNVLAIPRGIDTEEFTPYSEPEQVILVPCRLEREKGIHEVIRVFDQLSPDYPQWRLEIAGNGSAENSLRSLAERTSNPSKIRFLGKIPHCDMPSLYSRASVVVLNSSFEPFGAIITESGACARPVIATCHGGPSEIIQHKKTGILIDPTIPHTLRIALEYILQDEINARRMGELAREHICKNYSWTTEAKAYATLYEEVGEQNELGH